MHAYRKMHDIIQRTGEFYSSTSIRFHELRKYNQFFITINAERYFKKGNIDKSSYCKFPSNNETLERIPFSDG